VLRWFSRRVLSWRLSITMEAAFCVRRWRMLWLVTASRTSSIAFLDPQEELRSRSPVWLMPRVLNSARHALFCYR
jgi:hypothetical protein